MLKRRVCSPPTSTLHHRRRPLRQLAPALLGLVATFASSQSALTPPTKNESIVTLEKFSAQDRITDPLVTIGTERTRNSIPSRCDAVLAAPAGISHLKMLGSLPGFC